MNMQEKVHVYKSRTDHKYSPLKGYYIKGVHDEAAVQIKLSDS